MTPQAATIGSVVLLSAKNADYRLVDWQFDVLSGAPFSGGAQAYLHSDTFKDQLEVWLQDSVGDFLYPIVDFSFLGPFAGTSFGTIAVRALADALAIGLDMNNGVVATTGDPEQLSDFLAPAMSR